MVVKIAYQLLFKVMSDNFHLQKTKKSVAIVVLYHRYGRERSVQLPHLQVLCGIVRFLHFFEIG